MTESPALMFTLKRVFLFVCVFFFTGREGCFVVVFFKEKVKNYQHGQQHSFCKPAA